MPGQPHVRIRVLTAGLIAVAVTYLAMGAVFGAMDVVVVGFADAEGRPAVAGLALSAYAAGSLVAYVLRITDIDPLRYGLLFERFLNPERISMPDIDIDFNYERRD